MIRIHRCWRPSLKKTIVCTYYFSKNLTMLEPLLSHGKIVCDWPVSGLIWSRIHISFVKFNAIERKASSKIWHIVSRVYKYVNLETRRYEDITPYAGNNGPMFSPMTFVEDVGVVSVLASSRSISWFRWFGCGGKGKEKRKEKDGERKVCASRYCEFASGHLRIYKFKNWFL